MSVEVHHRLDGPEDAPVLVLSNSLGTSLEMWDEQLPALAERHRVVRYDQRGHGRSPVPDGPYSVAELGEDVVALLDRLGVERASFCGVSMGGMTGMWLGIDAPERIERLALCFTAAHLPPADMWAERSATARGEGLAPLVDATLERWFTAKAHAERPELIKRFRELLLATPPEGYAGCCEAIARHDERERLSAISASTLVLAADEDPSTPPEKGEEVAAAIPGARLEVIEHARHFAGAERPDQVNELLLRHLEAAG